MLYSDEIEKIVKVELDDRMTKRNIKNWFENAHRQLEIAEENILKNAGDIPTMHEVITIFTEKLTANQFADECGKIAKMLLHEDIGTVQITNEIGLKKLAYAVKDNEMGYFYNFNIEATNQQIHKIYDKLNSNKNIIKFIIVKED